MNISALIIFLCTILISQNQSCKNRLWNKKNAHENSELNVSDYINKLSFVDSNKIIVGAESTQHYFPMLQGKKIAVVVNQTSMVGERHLVDTLISSGHNVKLIYAPEHGFRGLADAGFHIDDGIDAETSIPIKSLYGSQKEPLKKDIMEIDLVIFDIQDVGARFYTYISTLYYVMSSCAKTQKKLIILDRPNPNGHYVDGPILDTAFKSFVGICPIPIVHGMTVAEFAKMVNEEGWLPNNLKCDIQIIPCQKYTHKMPYKVPIKPSPNLPNQKSILLYPSLCLFEGTVFSCGRGTTLPFQLYGHPEYKNTSFEFMPVSISGAKNPPLENIRCYGKNLSTYTEDELLNQKKLNLSYIIDAYSNFPKKENFFLKNKFFNKLTGGALLMQQIKDQLPEEEIRKTWQRDLLKFKSKRKKYLLYEE